jgi:hypothetical protein
MTNRLRKSSSPLQASKQKHSVNFFDITKYSAFILSIGGIFIHVIGYNAHIAYIKTWGLDANLFPLNTEETLMSGYYASITILTGIFQSIQNHPFVYASAFVEALIIVIIILSINHQSNKSKQRQLKEKTSSIYVKLPLFSLAYVSTGFLLLIFSIFAAGSIILIPGLIGHNYGEDLARREQNIFKSPTESQAQNYHLTEFLQDQKVIYLGYIIETSSEYFAIYDAPEKSVRVINRKNIEIKIQNILAE